MSVVKQHGQPVGRYGVRILYSLCLGSFFCLYIEHRRPMPISSAMNEWSQLAAETPQWSAEWNWLLQTKSIASPPNFQQECLLKNRRKIFAMSRQQSPDFRVEMCPDLQ